MADDALFLAPLPALPPVAAGSAPQMGRINPYDCEDASLEITLPNSETLSQNHRVMIQRYDGNGDHTLTINTVPGDSFDGQWTELVLYGHLEVVELQAINGQWHIVSGWRGGPAGAYADVDSTQEFENKVIDGSKNTLSNIPLGALAVGRVIGQNFDGSPWSATIVKLTEAQFSGIVKDANTIYLAV